MIFPAFKCLTFYLLFYLLCFSTCTLKSSSTKRRRAVNSLTETKIADDIRCSKELKQLCPVGALKSNFDVLTCVHKYQTLENGDLSPSCQHLIWTYKKNITTGDWFLRKATECSAELIKFPDCNTNSRQSGHLLSCLLDHKSNISSLQCSKFLTKIESIVFSDYRMIDKFTDSCLDDINKLHCGRLHIDSEDFVSQGETIECLSKSTEKLSNQCKLQIFRIAELQSDDYHLDRPLYFACREDREKFCDNVISGNHKVYSCLFRHYEKNNRLSDKCREKLFERQKLMSEDYKVARRLRQACRHEIHDNSCNKHLGKTKIKLVRLSHILVCLENAIHEDKEISSQCESEIIDHRRMLMRDYRLSPQLTMLCQKDIENFCGNKLELGGKTLHCLMEHSDKTKKHHVSEKCRVQLEDLMKIVDVGEDWRVDPVLHEACQPVVSVACKDVNDGEGRVLSCLMDHLDSDHMLEECRDKLLQIQYFIARDYKLDTRLYKACKKNAVKFCHAKDVWWDDPENMDPERGPLILPCLYRYAYHPMKEMRLSGQCLGEVKRVMRQRAVSVHLHPEIEEPCLADLSEHCVNRMYPGQELSCLQEHLDELSEPCRMAVGNYTELEADNMELNYELSKVCDSVFKRYCSDLLSGDIDEGKLLQCLIDNKNKHDVKLNVKCHAAIEHFQLITLKDYRFSPKFQQHCRSDVIKYCPSIKSKAEVISCLSEIHTEDILKDTKPPRLAEECQLQLRVDQFIMNEDVRFDPELQMACSHDQKKFCEDVTSGEAKVIECLKSHLHDLSDSCHKHIFKKEKEEMADNAIDYTLIKSCKSMIKQFCPNEDFSQVLTCLKHHQDEEDMNEVCRKEIIRRKIMQSKDYRLNPDLQHSCIKDIPKFCSKEMAMATDEELEGKVILCLKEQFRKHRLSMECEKEIQILVKESALDYRQDPVLMEACESEISRLCSEEKGWEGQGRVEECLKRKFKNKQIKNEKCSEQITRLLRELRADIHSDPLLYRACALDVKHYCVNIDPGEGRQLSCLLTILESNKANLNKECKTMLTNRKEMFEFAVVVAPVDTLNDLYDQVTNSPSKNYFFSIIMVVIGGMFIVGLLFGRVTKRVAAVSKNK